MAAIRAALVMLLALSFSTPARGSIVNGSFETGDFTGWTTVITGVPFVDWTVSGAGAGSGFFPLTSPQEGAFVGWNGFDGIGPMEFQLYQDLVVPPSPATFSWQDRVQWDFALTATATQPRSYAVQIRDPATGSLLTELFGLSTGTAHVVGDTGWQTHSADISAFAGTSVRLFFREFIPESFTGPGQLEIDNVVIESTTPTPGVPECTAWITWTLLGATCYRWLPRKTYPRPHGTRVATMLSQST